MPLIGGGYDGTYYGVAREREDHLRRSATRRRWTGSATTSARRSPRRRARRRWRRSATASRPSSTAAAESNGKYAAPAAGLKAVYTNTTVDFGSTDVSPDRAGHQELRRRLGVLRDEREHQPRDRAGPRAERREDEGGAHGDRLRPAAARRAVARRRSDRRSSSRRAGRRSRRRPRPPSSSRPTSRSTPTSPACPTSGSTPATSTATWPSPGSSSRARTSTRAPTPTTCASSGSSTPADLGCQTLDISAAGYGKQSPTICT